MKSKMFALLAIVTIVGFTGCCGGKSCLPCGGLFSGGGVDTCCGEICESGCGETCCDEGCGETCGEMYGEVPCEPARCGLFDGLCSGRRNAGPGPVAGAVAYPYYTNRGPRDFLAKNPPSIGP